MKPAVRRKRPDGFTAISYVATLVVMFIMGSTILAVVVAGLPNLPSALRSEEVQLAVRLSASTATFSTVMCMLLALPTGYALTRTNLPLKRVVGVLLELTLSLPYLLLGLSLLILFSSDIGKSLKEAGFKVVFEPLGIVIAQLVVNLPFCIRLVRTAFSDVEMRLESIAQLLGASSFSSFLTVTLPLCKSALISAFILTWSRALGEFGATLMLVGITRRKTETLPGSIYLNISTGNNEMAMATATIVLMISGVALLIANLLNCGTKHSRLGDRL